MAMKDMPPGTMATEALVTAALALKQREEKDKQVEAEVERRARLALANLGKVALSGETSGWATVYFYDASDPFDARVLDVLDAELAAVDVETIRGRCGVEAPIGRHAYEVDVADVLQRVREGLASIAEAG